jgi:predicted TIM-barrel fold metal-dependent hydrolase
MIIDVHGHYHPRRFNAALDAMGINGRPMEPHPDTDDPEHIEKRLQLMEEAGVGMQVLSPAAGRAPYGADEAKALEASKIGNDIYAELVAKYPDKFKALATLPLPHIDASLKELRRCYDELGFCGVNMHISAMNRSVAEDEFLPIYEEVNRRNGIIFYHPCANSIQSPMIADYGLGAAVGTSLEDAAIGCHLIGKKVATKYPNITYIIPHLGGIIPMLLQRLDNQFSMKARGLDEPPSVTARKFYYDTVGHGSVAALTCAYLAFGAEHIVPGSDFPVLLSYETYRETFSWIREAGLPGDAAEQILERTAPTILKL